MKRLFIFIIILFITIFIFNPVKTGELKKTPLKSRQKEQTTGITLAVPLSVKEGIKNYIAPSAEPTPPAHFCPNQNILLLWTEKGGLKAITIITYNPRTKIPALLTVPTRTLLPGETLTTGEIYARKGLSTFTRTLEKAFNTQIPHYIVIDQTVVEQFSRRLGEVNLKGETVPVISIFEDTLAGRRLNDTDLVKALVQKLLLPGEMWKVPGHLSFLVQNIKTNLTLPVLLDIFSKLPAMKLNSLTKVSLPSPGVTGRILSQITQESLP
ncbi:LCP family protein [Carboxydothermus hydrogenoformans]|uniref:Cell envelope-related transcriptional attenuator domain-containing protein n=1 Tax=Carboxydothermus hydrogenoformans (strain ATCC BAA-161 / DSM 6008 / Z-2901) TaxID=246194 RepID=Q3A962_CARHZ|nr:hypothetical protein [Carboxydothermus hydrogenoformans]ABB15225.1 hypothetical protein CHY_2529 [Carboxydothermus hydrogenoformans Z-2901]